MIRSVISGAALVCSLALASSGAMAAAAHITMERAKHEIEGDGYTGVAHLHQTNAGWEATARESGKPVTVLVTKSGSVEKTK
jgi:hypothetical protein